MPDQARPGRNSFARRGSHAFAVWHALQRQWPQILHRQMATNGPELQSEQRQVRMLPLVAWTMEKEWPEHWFAIVLVGWLWGMRVRVRMRR